MSLAACGGGGGAGEGSAHDGVTDTTIKVGTISDRTGPTAANMEPWLHGVMTVVDEANDNGGVNGRKIDLKTEDDKYDGSLGLAAYKKLVSQDPVVAIVGVNTGDLQPIVAPLLDKDKVPVIGGQTSTKSLLKPLQKYFFGVSPDYSVQVDVMLAYGQQQTGKDQTRVAVVDNGTSTGVEVADLVKERNGKNGYNVVDSIVLPPDATTADAVVQKLMSDHVDQVAYHGNSTGVNLLLKAQQKFGAHFPIVGIAPSGTAASFAGIDPKFGKDFAFVQAVTPSAIKVAGTADMVKAADAAGYGDETTDPAYVTGYISGTVLVEGLKAAGKDLDRASLTDALEHLNVDTAGLSGPLSYSATKHAGLDAMRPYTWDYKSKSFIAAGEFSDYSDVITNEYTK